VAMTGTLLLCHNWYIFKLTLTPLRVWNGRKVAAINGAATCSVTNEEAVSEELGQEFNVWGLSATCTSAVILKKGP